MANEQTTRQELITKLRAAIDAAHTDPTYDTLVESLLNQLEALC